ncbi:uncharacterized protein LOC122031614 [Zingiber officinale]|uniref:uncharacterized protein LOC122031614 n=1 Tax=Zingiber officinale TaxID=94328 RepID=UPI001C4A86B8|nr:uncharacterized protein LOC122031614 [Zingiber officinale]
MADGKTTLWYSCFISDMDDHDLSVISSDLHLDDTYELRVPTKQEHPASPPEGFVTIFRDQILGGLRFPIHPFISSLSEYFGVCISQLAPNFFRAVCGTIILCRVYELPLTVHLFHHFYSFKRSESGVFMVQARPDYKFFTDMPSSNKGWKSRFFFVRLPQPLVGPIQWRPDLPDNLPSHQHQPACISASEALQGILVNFSVLLLEDFLFLFGLSLVQKDIGAPFEAAMYRAYSSNVKCRSSPYLKNLGEELRQGVAASSQPGPSALHSAPTPSTIMPVATHEGTSSALPPDAALAEDPVAVEQVDLPMIGQIEEAPGEQAREVTVEQLEEMQVAFPRPADRLKLQRKRKRVTPAIQASPPRIPPSRRSSATLRPMELKATTPARESITGPEVPIASPHISVPASDRGTAPAQASSQAPTSSPDQPSLHLTDQPGSSDTPFVPPPLDALASTSRSRKKTRKKYSFTDFWHVPSSAGSGVGTETTVGAPPLTALIELEGDLATSWRSGNHKFYKNAPLGGQDQAACLMAAYAYNLQRENEALKAQLEEIELPLTPRDPLNPTPGDLAHYLRLLGESADTARDISHAAFDKIRALEAALHTSKSELASEVEKRQELAAELEKKDAQLASSQEARESLQKTLAEVQNQLASNANREKALQSQWEASHATLKAVQADLLKIQEEVSQGQEALIQAQADQKKAETQLAEYQAGEVGRLRAYRRAYVTSPFFIKKMGDIMHSMVCCGVGGGARQMLEQNMILSVPTEDFVDIGRIMDEIPDGSFPSFKDDDDLFLLPESLAEPASGPTEHIAGPTEDHPPYLDKKS